MKGAVAGEKYQLRRFRVITPSREYLLEAESEEDAREWRSTLHVAIQNAILHTSHSVPHGPASMRQGGPELVREISKVDGNDGCADCGASGPTWVSVNLGVVLCIECSGVHRSFGCQLSKVRSLELDIFMPETIQLFQKLGNNLVNSFWCIDPAKKSPSVREADKRKQFIEDKYLRRLFTGEQNSHSSPMTSPKAPFSSPTLSLFESVQTDNLPRTCELLFRHAVDVSTVHVITGSTPLHMAAAAGQLLQVHLLLLNGADPVGRNQQGRTPAEVALRSGHGEVAEHLNRFQSGAQRGAKRTFSVGSGTDTGVTQRIRKALEKR